MSGDNSITNRRPKLSRERNGCWKGGRVIASNGYVLIKVGFDHHLADCRGYAYEHRLVAEKKLRRRLKAGEIIHHRNKVRTDNRPANIEVVRGNAEHFLNHRRVDRGLQLPDEQNAVIACACGCGETFLKFDASGRPRIYVTGHNPAPSPTVDSVLAALMTSGDLADIAAMTGLPIRSIAVCLSKLKRQGKIIHVGRGKWGLK